MSAKLSIEQLRREHCYFVLSVKQQKMVEVYLGTGDKVKAVQAAFNTKSAQVAKVMTYHYFLRLGSNVTTILMNRKKFESLPKAGQDAIRKFSGEATVTRFAETYDANNAQAMNALKSDPNRVLIVPPRSELDTLQATFQNVLEKWRDENARNTQLWRLVETEIARLRTGG